MQENKRSDSSQQNYRRSETTTKTKVTVLRACTQATRILLINYVNLENFCINWETSTCSPSHCNRSKRISFIFMCILIYKIDLSVAFLSKYFKRGCFTVQINTAIAAAQYLQRLQRKNENRTFLLCICFSSKELKKDFYLGPYTCAELGFLYQDEGDLDRAKEYLERARYLIWIIFINWRQFFMRVSCCWSWISS